MIGSALKKLAKENGMSIHAGVAYGSYRGYAATFSEGAGYKRIDFSVQFPEPNTAAELRVKLDSINLMKEYRVQNIIITEKAISITFHDNPGTMKKVRAFMDWLIPVLDELGAAKMGVCSSCGQLVYSDGCWKLINGTAHHFHRTCAEKVCREIRESEQQEKMKATGSYLTGAIGALIGSLLGAVVWALVLLAGYVASLVGLLIGFLAERGYCLLKGKEGKGKLIILVLAVIFGVVAGTLGCDVISLVQMISAGELPGFVYGDIPYLIAELWIGYPEYTIEVVKSILLGLVFAALGVYGILRKTHAENATAKFIDLK